MNRVELVALMAEKSGLTKTDADKALSAFVDSVTETLAKQEEIRLIGFGTFAVAHRNASEARNLHTGETIAVPERNVPKFKPGKTLKDAVA
ncbi:MAG: HU family DNA-binding protein [Alphaproteobacteria bacterium]|nr:HU family DNA-binding protein [Alphaproteobacteria bacterium]